jgi:hypothetical protein
MNEMKPQDELKDYPLLKNLQGSNPYHVPENYFETLAARVEQKLEKKPAVIKRLPVSRFIIRLTAAASITLILGTAGWFYLSNTKDPEQESILTIEEVAGSIYFDDLDISLLKEEVSGTITLAQTNEIENYLLENDFNFLYE